MAIYGQSFVEGGRSVFSLFKRHGIATLLNDNTTDIILKLAVFVGGALGMLVTGAIGIAVYGTAAEGLLLCTIGGAIVSCGLVHSVTSTTPTTFFTPLYLLTPLHR